MDATEGRVWRYLLDGNQTANAKDVALNCDVSEHYAQRIIDRIGTPIEVRKAAAEAAQGEGRKDDGGKVRLELVPPELVFSVGAVLTFGAMKYDDRNWERGMSWGRVFGALMRHLWAWWGGKGPTTKSFLFTDTDAETEMSHLWHAGCCIAFLITYEERGAGTDDRYKGEDHG